MLKPSAITPQRTTVATQRGKFCVYQWGCDRRGILPTLVLTHATGFHARCWDQVVAQLGARHVIAMDLRGHGRSPPQAFRDWFDFSEDLVAVLSQLQVTGAIGVGHSMGGFCSVAAAIQNPERFARLVLIDPVILEPAHYECWNPESLVPEPRHFAAKRRSRFASLQEFSSRVGAKPPYSNFDPAVLEDYCRHAVRPVIATGEVELACAPAFEARIYETAQANGELLHNLQRVKMPVTVVRAKRAASADAAFDFRYSPTWPLLAQQFACGEDRYLPGETHFLPLEKPALVARLIAALAADSSVEES